jgi:hypothetical protein
MNDKNVITMVSKRQRSRHVKRNLACKSYLNPDFLYNIDIKHTLDANKYDLEH